MVGPGPHGYCPFGRPYNLAVDCLTNRDCPPVAARFAAENLAKPNIPPYFFIKNCILAVRCYSSSDHSKAEAYRLNAEHKYANSLRDALAAPDDGSLSVLHRLRSELDQLHASASRVPGGPELASSSSSFLPRLPPIPMFAGEARELAAARVSAAAPAPELPVGWVVYTDAVSGREYYHHSVSLVTQWRVPGLLVGWDMFKDAVSGSVYYWNESTRVTQWDCSEGEQCEDDGEGGGEGGVEDGEKTEDPGQTAQRANEGVTSRSG